MDRISKPRVFLSHSKKDIAFIERLERDLRKCQIEPWLDDVELRHGKPWLDAIFEDGIPSCDAVLVYFTENSLASKVVKKELDAGVISQLEDGSVALLPYVESGGLRESLRGDIKALQVPEWNEKNFEHTLARCVAEIWRSFHERRVSLAVAQEKVKRLEAEDEVGKLRNQSTSMDRNICGYPYEEIVTMLKRQNLMHTFLKIAEECTSSGSPYYPDGNYDGDKIAALATVGLFFRERRRIDDHSFEDIVMLNVEGQRLGNIFYLENLMNQESASFGD